MEQHLQDTTCVICSLLSCYVRLFVQVLQQCVPQPAILFCHASPRIALLYVAVLGLCPRPPVSKSQMAYKSSVSQGCPCVSQGCPCVSQGCLCVTSHLFSSCTCRLSSCLMSLQVLWTLGVQQQTLLTISGPRGITTSTIAAVSLPAVTTCLDPM